MVGNLIIFWKCGENVFKILAFSFTFKDQIVVTPILVGTDNYIIVVDKTYPLQWIILM